MSTKHKRARSNSFVETVVDTVGVGKRGEGGGRGGEGVRAK